MISSTNQMLHLSRYLNAHSLSCFRHVRGYGICVYVTNLPPSTTSVTPLIMSALSLNKYNTGWTMSFTSAKKTEFVICVFAVIFV